MGEIVHKPNMVKDIIKWMEECQGVIYIKGLDIRFRDGIYKAEFEMNNSDMPLIISGEFMSDEEFFIYLCKELISKRLFTTRFNTVRTITP